MTTTGLLLGAAMPFLAAQQSPGPRYGHELVYDEARAITVLYGGFGEDGAPLGDTWGWDGSTWRLLAETGPFPRRWPAAAYDARRRVIVLHGGRDGVGSAGTSLTDTWTWDGAAWSLVSTEGPTGRDHHRAAYDRGRDRVVLFGGWDGERVLGDTWEWNGSRWRLVDTVGPSPRAPHGMVYDEGRRRVVLMGGQDLANTFGDLWTWDGRRWTPLDPAAPRPGPRSFHAMTYDSGRAEVLLLGGREGDSLLTDLWSWDGAAWTLLSTAVPRRRGFHAAAFDRARGELVVHGSGNLSGGHWYLSGSTWTWGRDEGWSVPSPGDLEILMVGNAGVQLSDGDHALLVDLPYESGAFGYQRYEPDSLRPCCAPVSVITHHHRDHFAEELFRARPAWRIVGPPSVVADLPAERVLSGDSVTVGRFSIVVVPTPHTPDHRSYRIRWEGLVLFVSGDTDDADALPPDTRFDVLFINPWLACRLVDAGRRLPADRTLIYHLQADGSDRICGAAEVPVQGARYTLPASAPG